APARRDQGGTAVQPADVVGSVPGRRRARPHAAHAEDPGAARPEAGEGAPDPGAERGPSADPEAAGDVPGEQGRSPAEALRGPAARAGTPGRLGPAAGSRRLRQ